jgi:hypothetical protein
MAFRGWIRAEPEETDPADQKRLIVSLGPAKPDATGNRRKPSGAKRPPYGSDSQAVDKFGFGPSDRPCGGGTLLRKCL